MITTQKSYGSQRLMRKCSNPNTIFTTGKKKEMRCKEQRKDSDHQAPDLQAPCHHPDYQVSNHQSYQLKREPSKRRSIYHIFKQRKKYGELQDELLRIEEQTAKAQARAKIYDKGNIDVKAPLQTPAMADIKEGDSR